MKKILIASVALIAAAAAHAAPPADLQQRLDALVKGSPGGAAVAWVDADGLPPCDSGDRSPRPDSNGPSAAIAELGWGSCTVRSEATGASRSP